MNRTRIFSRGIFQCLLNFMKYTFFQGFFPVRISCSSPSRRPLTAISFSIPFSNWVRRLRFFVPPRYPFSKSTGPSSFFHPFHTCFLDILTIVQFLSYYLVLYILLNLLQSPHLVIPHPDHVYLFQNISKISIFSTSIYFS